MIVTVLNAEVRESRFHKGMAHLRVTVLDDYETKCILNIPGIHEVLDELTDQTGWKWDEHFVEGLKGKILSVNKKRVKYMYTEFDVLELRTT